jgi:hypothetical protein
MRTAKLEPAPGDIQTDNHLAVPGSATNWQIDFHNTKTGTDIVSSAMAVRKGD